MSHQLAIGAVLTVIGLISIQELLQMFAGGNADCSRPAALGSAAIIFAGFAAVLTTADDRYLLPSVALAAIYPYLLEVFSKGKPSFLKAAHATGASLYVALPLSLLVLSAMKDSYYHPYLLLGIFVLTWTNDTFAFLTGSWLGKHKLVPHISPKKSIEGLIGGGLFTVGAAWLYSRFNQDISNIQWLVTGIIVVIFGTLGDLSESVIKRNFNTKDSGNILPGHGGFLDRIDGLLFIGPAVYFYLLMAVK
jgi:phosphatidate cytidylyltransferase